MTTLQWKNNPSPVEIETAHLPGADIKIMRLTDGSWGVVLLVDPHTGCETRSEAREIAEAFARRWMGGVS